MKKLYQKIIKFFTTKEKSVQYTYYPIYLGLGEKTKQLEKS